MSKQERVAGIKLEGAIQQSLPSGWTPGGSGGGPRLIWMSRACALLITQSLVLVPACRASGHTGSFLFLLCTFPLSVFDCGVRRSSCQGISLERMALSNPVVLVRGNGSGGAVINGSRFQALSGLKVQIQEIVWG